MSTELSTDASFTSRLKEALDIKKREQREANETHDLKRWREYCSFIERKLKSILPAEWHESIKIVERGERWPIYVAVGDSPLMVLDEEDYALFPTERCRHCGSYQSKWGLAIEDWHQIHDEQVVVDKCRQCSTTEAKTAVLASHVLSSGLTVRQHAAITILGGLSAIQNFDYKPDAMIDDAVRLADSLIARLDQKP